MGLSPSSSSPKGAGVSNISFPRAAQSMVEPEGLVPGARGTFVVLQEILHETRNLHAVSIVGFGIARKSNRPEKRAPQWRERANTVVLSYGVQPERCRRYKTTKVVNCHIGVRRNRSRGKVPRKPTVIAS